MTIEDWLTATTEEFVKANVPSARLDAELLLCHMLGVNRTWLVSHADESLTRAALSQKGGTRRMGLKEYGTLLVERRLRREPLAYLLGSKEFYGRDFIVNKNVLIPRPETEVLIELVLKHGLSGHVLDVGTGSGAIGLTLKLELPSVNLTLSDISEETLDVAKKNAKKLKVKDVEFVQSDLLEAFLRSSNSQIPIAKFDVIVANLPYVDKSWERSPETSHEPRLALFAGDGGLALIKELIDQAKDLVVPGGYLLLEADPKQMNDIIQYAYATFRQRDRLGYALLLQKV